MKCLAEKQHQNLAVLINIQYQSEVWTYLHIQFVLLFYFLLLSTLYNDSEDITTMK